MDGRHLRAAGRQGTVWVADVRAKNAADMVLSLRAMAAAREAYTEAFEVHATAEQLAAFWGEPDEAETHRIALRIALDRGDEELNAQPLRPGAW